MKTLKSAVKFLPGHLACRHDDFWTRRFDRRADFGHRRGHRRKIYRKAVIPGLPGRFHQKREQHHRGSVHLDVRLCHGKRLHEDWRRRFCRQHRPDPGHHGADNRGHRTDGYRNPVCGDGNLLGNLCRLRADLPVAGTYRRS